MHFPPGSKYEQNRDPAHGAGRLERCFQNLFGGHCYRTCHFSDHLSAVFCVGCFPRKRMPTGTAGRRRDRRVDPRWCYRGVAEVSIYVGEQFRGHGLGYHLLTELCHQAEKAGYWTLQSTVLQDNAASRALHTKCGFRLVGRRERIARDCHGRWLDTFLMEYRAAANEPEGYKKL